MSEVISTQKHVESTYILNIVTLCRSLYVFKLHILITPLSANEKAIQLRQMPLHILDIDFCNARRRTLLDSQHYALYANSHVLTQVQHFDQPKISTWLASKLSNSINSQPISKIQKSVLSMITPIHP